MNTWSNCCFNCVSCWRLSFDISICCPACGNTSPSFAAILSVHHNLCGFSVRSVLPIVAIVAMMVTLCSLVKTYWPLTADATDIRSSEGRTCRRRILAGLQVSHLTVGTWKWTTFLRNGSKLVLDYKASHPRRQYSF
jgi:hypothetical protein